MHVRKFTANTLDEALKEIKRELGPDAIILKTNTNRGKFPSFNKKKIEITAAISEKSLGQKMKVDIILDDAQKENLYKNSSNIISNIINEYGEENPGKQSYQRIGLNRQIKSKKTLDDFLNENNTADEPISSNTLEKIFELENRINFLTERLEDKPTTGIMRFKNFLKSLDIEESYVQELIKKACEQLDAVSLNDFDALKDFSVQEMLKEIKTDIACFSRVESEPVITLLISEVSCGQSMMVEKLASIKSDSLIIKNGKGEGGKTLASQYFEFIVEKADGISQIITQCRKGLSDKKAIFIDYKINIEDLNDTKKVVEAIRRVFPNLEVLIHLSAIHSENYNKRVLQKYQKIANGMTISFLDICANFASIFNLTLNFPNLPIKFFSTGEVIPEDIEAASPERLIAGIFRIE